MSLFGAVADSYVVSVSASYNATLAALPSGATVDGRWKLDEASGAAAPVATIGTDGTWVSTPTGSQLGQAGLISDGGTSVLTAAGFAVKLPLGTRGTAGTLWVWSAHSTGGSAGIPILRDDTSSNGTFLDISGTNPLVRVNSANHTVSSVTASTLRTGARHLYGLGTDGTTWYLWIDGTLVDSWARTASFSNIATAIYLGCNGKNTSQGYVGWFDDFAYSNSKLSDADFAALWAAGTA